jgi:predicted DNA-binding transcriptional regulator AlpA
MSTGTDKSGAEGFALIGLRKVAAILDTSVRTVQRKIAAGELPKVIRIGKLAKLQIADVYGYIERQKQRCGRTERAEK